MLLLMPYPARQAASQHVTTHSTKMICSMLPQPFGLAFSKMDQGACIHFADIKTTAAADVDYQRLVGAMLHGFPSSRRSLPACLVPYWNGREHLSVDSDIVLKGPRIVVPEALRARVLQDLHKSHQGLVRTKRQARQVVY